MSIVKELERQLHAGVRDASIEFKGEAPTIARVTGLREPNYKAATEQPVYLESMKYPTLGETGIRKDGEVQYVAVNSGIPKIVENAMKVYNKGLEWAKQTVYKIAKMVTKHEKTHALSSRVAKGKPFDQRTVDVMESITTYGLKKGLEEAGKPKEAEYVERTNPYPRSWLIGQAADWAPYISPHSKRERYAGFIEDTQTEGSFYKPLARLAGALTKSVFKRGVEAWKRFAEQKKLQPALSAVDRSIYKEDLYPEYREPEKLAA